MRSPSPVRAQQGGLRAVFGRSPPAGRGPRAVPAPARGGGRAPGRGRYRGRGTGRMGGALPRPPRLNKGKVAEPPRPARGSRPQTKAAAAGPGGDRGSPQVPPAPPNRTEGKGGPFGGTGPRTPEHPPHSGVSPPQPLAPSHLPSGGSRCPPLPPRPLYLPPSSARASCHQRQTPQRPPATPLSPPIGRPPRPAPLRHWLQRTPHSGLSRPLAPLRIQRRRLRRFRRAEPGANGAAGAPADTVCAAYAAAQPLRSRQGELFNGLRWSSRRAAPRGGDCAGHAPHGDVPGFVNPGLKFG